MGHISRNMKENGADNDLNCWGLSQEIPEETNFNMLPCDTLMENVGDFCRYMKSLLETKVKSFGLIPLAKEISKQPSIDSVISTLMRIYNEKEQTWKVKIQKVKFEEKRSTRK